MRYAVFVATLAVAIAGPRESGHLLAQQKPALKAPTEADWTAVAKLPDFTGVWEVGFGAAPGRGAAPAAGGAAPAARGGAPGGGRGRAGGFPAGPQLTPAYAEKRRA